MLPEEDAVRIYRDCKKSKEGIPGRKPQFSLADLEGERIAKHRAVKTTARNPEILDIIDFESGRALIVGVEGWYEGTTHHWMLVEQGKVKYSDCLFYADVRGMRQERSID